MSEATRRIGIVKVSMGLLESLLHLPDLHNVIDVRRRGGAGDFDAFEILVAGPTLPETEIGSVTPTVDYTVTVTEDADRMVPKKSFSGAFKPQATHEQQGSGYDSAASGYELQGRSTAPTSDEAAAPELEKIGA